METNGVMDAYAIYMVVKPDGSPDSALAIPESAATIRGHLSKMPEMEFAGVMLAPNGDEAQRKAWEMLTVQHEDGSWGWKVVR